MRAEQKKQIGARLREKRELAGYTREQLGELCGLSPRFLANVELGDSTFSLETLMRVCRVLCCSSDELLFGRRAESRDDLCARIGRLDPAYRGALEKNTAGLFRGGGPGGSGKVAPFLRPSIRDKEKRCPRERRPGTALFGLRRRRAVTSDRTASGICPPDSRCRRWGQRGRRPAPPPRRAPAGSRSGGSCPGASR